MGKLDFSAEGLVANIKDLVTLPEVALRIASMVDDPTSSAADIGREISHDAALTARLLRIANSPAFGQHGKIATISRAITVLGVRQVRDLTVGLTAIRTFDGIGNELVTMASFWRHSVLCAVAAGQIAGRRERGRDDTPFVAGLLHDIGQLVLFSRAPDLARQSLLTWVDSADDRGLYLCERDIIGFDHAAVGLALAKNWSLPSSLQECIEFHHEPERARLHPLEVATVHIANSVAVLAEIGSTDPGDAPAISAAALRAVKLDAAAVREIVLQTQESAAEVLPLMMAA
ncbi:MAG TPA: HDOD domain-containing protein [Steroidobacteraceae bacterium]|nr:HDOD domain-containing protein [Steroidobacteraceae bacterium]